MSSHSNNIIAGDQALLMGVFGFGHQPDGQYGPEATNFKQNYHPQQHLPFQFCLRITLCGCPWSCSMYSYVGVAGAGHHPDGHGGSETRNFKHDYHPKQLLFNQLCPDISPWVRPWSGSTPGWWNGWTPPRWSWWSGNNEFETSLSTKTTFVIITLP